jgi:proline dehydrogenase
MFRIFRRSLLRARNTGYRQYTSRAHGVLLTKRTAARVTVFTVSSLLLANTVFADNGLETIKDPSLGSFVRAYTVYTICSVPALVDASPRLLSFLTSIPGIKQITEAFVRITFFDQVWFQLLCCITTKKFQFVGGDTVTDALPLLRSLRSTNRGILLAYSAEVDEKEATGASRTDGTHSSHLNVSTTHKRIVDETLHCIDIAADLEEELKSKSPSIKGKRTWVAVKMTAMLPDASALLALSSFIVESRKDHRTPAAIPFPGSPRIEDLDVILKTPSIGHLTPAQVSGIRELYDDLVRICTHARERGIKIIVDAEYRYVWFNFLFVSFTDDS